jgi:hypothetical protein
VRLRFLPVIFDQTVEQPIVAKMPLWKAVAFAARLGLSMLSSVHAAPASGGDTAQGLYEVAAQSIILLSFTPLN